MRSAAIVGEWDQRGVGVAVDLGVATLYRMNRFRCGVLRVLAAVLLLLGPASDVSAGGEKSRGDAVDLLSAVPADARLVVAIDDLQRAWDSPAIGTAISSLQSVTDLSGTLDAWSILAKQLGMKPDEAARRLLGSRFLLVSEPDGDGASWAIATVVDAETAGLLRRRLAAVPRALRDGLPVLAIEGNAFELVVQDVAKRRVSSAMASGTNAGDALVVLGPSSRARLFDALLGSALGAGARGETMNDAQAGRIARALPDGTDVVVLRADADNDRAWFVLGAEIEGHTIRSNFLRLNPELAASTVTTIKPWKLGVFDRASRNSLLAIAEVDALAAPVMPAMREAFGEELIGRLRLPEPGTFAGRAMLLGFESVNGPLDVVTVMETPGTTAASIQTDRSVATSLSALFGGERFEDFGGLFPNALRKVDLRPVMQARGPEVLDALWPESGPVLAWTVRNSVERGAGDERGWMVLGIGEDHVLGVAESLIAQDEDDHKHASLPWVSVFEVRPRALLDELAGQVLALPPIVRSMGAIERVRAQTLAARPDLLRGGAVIEFVRPEKGDQGRK